MTNANQKIKVTVEYEKLWYHKPANWLCKLIIRVRLRGEELVSKEQVDAALPDWLRTLLKRSIRKRIVEPPTLTDVVE